MIHATRLARAACIAALLLLAACATALRAPTAEQIHGLRGRDAEAVLYSGERVLLRSPRVEGDSVFGGWTSGPEGEVRAAVALEDIQSLRTVSMGPDPHSARAIVERSLLIASILVGALMALLVLG